MYNAEKFLLQINKCTIVHEELLIRYMRRFTTFRPNIIAQVKFDANQIRRRLKSAQKKNESTKLHSALIKKQFVCELNCFAFSGNSLYRKHDCVYALPLRLSVNHYYKQVISAQSQKKYCITVIAM